MDTKIVTFILVAVLVVWLIRIIMKWRRPARGTQTPPWRPGRPNPPLYGGHVPGGPADPQSNLFGASHHADTAHTHTPGASDAGSFSYDSGPGSYEGSYGGDFGGGGGDFGGGGAGGDFGGGGDGGSSGGDSGGGSS